MRISGKYETFGSTKHFIPDPLPPQNPPFSLTAEMTTLYGEAMSHLAKLNEMIHKLPDIKRFIRAYVTKEALLSSSIEGIHTTILEVFTQPLLDSKPSKETQLVMNYTKALDAALSLMKEHNYPLSSRVLLNAHKILMDIGQGDKANPGHYRKISVSVGNLIPPTAAHIPHLMTDLEHYINEDVTLPPLIKAGLAHVQFEIIHPFLDGNGRIGRLLIVLMLLESNLLSDPILYPSYYLKKHHHEYYMRLDRIRTHGDFEGWITFYLTAIKESSIDAYRRAKDIESLTVHLKHVITKDIQSGKSADMRLQAINVLFNYPVITTNELAIQLDVSYNTAAQIITDCINLQILTQENEQKRGKLFKLKPYFEILEKEYE